MADVRRIYVEKKDAFAVKAKELQEDLKNYLGMTGIDKVRVLIRYDVENISEETFQKACKTVFSEPPVDMLYEEQFPMPENAKSLVVDNVIESINLCKYFTIICEDPDPICDFIMNTLHRSATVYDAEGTYEHRKKKVIITIMKRSQAVELRNFIRRTQPPTLPRNSAPMDSEHITP